MHRNIYLTSLNTKVWTGATVSSFQCNREHDGSDYDLEIQCVVLSGTSWCEFADYKELNTPRLTLIFG